MPKSVSRLSLVVTGAKIEPLQDISEEDAGAEGMPVDHAGNFYEPPPEDQWQGYRQASFSLLWSELHGPESWKGNPEVVALTFEMHRANFETMLAA